MKTPIARLWVTASSLAIFFAACQKEISQSTDNKEPTEVEVRTGGAVADDPGAVAKVPMLVSYDYYQAMNQEISARGGNTSKKDTDGDGIPDVNDSCPKQKETINGYQDNDGCPDTPPPTSKDTDGDGIPDTSDSC